ncbi:hypothetical protein D3C71_1455030 [compost metagenome]
MVSAECLRLAAVRRRFPYLKHSLAVMDTGRASKLEWTGITARTGRRCAQSPVTGAIRDAYDQRRRLTGRRIRYYCIPRAEQPRLFKRGAQEEGLPGHGRAPLSAQRAGPFAQPLQIEPHWTDRSECGPPVLRRTDQPY